jgi:hypothetical protein
VQVVYDAEADRLRVAHGELELSYEADPGVLTVAHGGMEIAYDPGADELTVKGFGTMKVSDYSGIEVGAAGEPFVLGDALKSYLDGLKTWMDGHTHPDPSSGTTGPPSSTSPTIGTVLSSKIKGE